MRAPFTNASDVAAYTAQLRGVHVDDADTRMALACLGNITGGAEPAPFGPVLADD